MNKLKKFSEGANFAAVNVGKWADLGDHTLTIAPGVEIPGKVFTGKALGSTGAEVSFQIMPAAAGVEFLHKHKTHEEIYIVLRGSGEYQVDGTAFPVTEGSVVRVSPAGKRSWRNTGSEPMVMACIQAAAGSTAPGIADGEILNEPVVW